MAFCNKSLQMESSRRPFDGLREKNMEKQNNSGYGETVNKQNISKQENNKNRMVKDAKNQQVQKRNKNNNKENQNVQRKIGVKESSNTKDSVQANPQMQKQKNSQKKNKSNKTYIKDGKNADKEHSTHTGKNAEEQYGREKKNTAGSKKYTKTENDIKCEKKNNVRNKADVEAENNTKNKNGNKNRNKRTNEKSNDQQEQENTEQPQKHWTQLNREYRLRRLGIYEEQQSYREIPRHQIDLPLNGCGFGDEHFLFAGPDGSPKYEDINAPWNDFIDWMEKVCKKYKKEKDTTRKVEYILGQELVVHAVRRNIHTIYCYMSLYWVDFRDGFLLQKNCPETVLEFVRGIMANKMTEKQMWGTVDDRCPGGTVIVFDEKYMPKEGEDTGTIKFECRPNFIQERMEKMKRSNGMI